MGSAVYYGGIRPKQYDNFEKLKETATQRELIELTNHPNGVVRCYAFWALSKDKSVDLFQIILNHINDYELVKTQFGCIGGQEKVGDFFISYATLDSIQEMELDSIAHDFLRIRVGDKSQIGVNMGGFQVSDVAYNCLFAVSYFRFFQ